MQDDKVKELLDLMNSNPDFKGAYDYKSLSETLSDKKKSTELFQTLETDEDFKGAWKSVDELMGLKKKVSSEGLVNGVQTSGKPLKTSQPKTPFDGLQKFNLVGFKRKVSNIDKKTGLDLNPNGMEYVLENPSIPFGNQKTSSTPSLTNAGGFMADIQANLTNNRYSAVQKELDDKAVKASQIYKQVNGELNLPTVQGTVLDDDDGADRTTIDKFVDKSGLSTLAGGFSSAIYKPLAGASSFINNTVGSIYKGITGKEYLEGEDKRGLFGKLADDADKLSERAATIRELEGTSVATDVYHGLVGTVPLIMGTMMTGGQNVGSQTPQIISNLTKYMASTGALKSYDTAKLENKNASETTKEVVKGGFEGALEGLSIDAQMLVGRAWGGKVVDLLEKKGLFSGKSAGAKLVEANAIGSTFMGTSIGRNLLNGEEVDWKEAATQYGMGLAFEVAPVIRAMRSDLSNTIAKQRVNKAVLESVTKRSQEGKLASFLNATPEQIAGISKLPKTHEELFADALEQGVKAGETSDITKKTEGYTSQIAITNAANIKEIVSDINKNPEKFIEGIEKSELPIEVKDQLIEKINQTYKETNPVEVRKSELGAKIKQSEDAIKSVSEQMKSEDPVTVAEKEAIIKQEQSNLAESKEQLKRVVEEQVGVVSETKPSNLVQAFKMGEQGISEYREVAKKQFLEAIRESRKEAKAGFSPAGAKALLEYAILSVADGTIKSGKALASALGLDHNKEIEEIYKKALTSANEYAKTNPDFARVKERQGALLVEMQDIAKKAGDKSVTEPELKALTDYAKRVYDGGNIKTATEFQEFLGVKNNAVRTAFERVQKGLTDLAVEQQKIGEKSIKKAVKDVTEGKITGTTTISNKEALRERISTVNKSIKEGQAQVKQASKDLSGILNEMLNKNAQNKISNATHQRLTQSLAKAVSKDQVQDFANKLLKVLNDKEYLNKVDEINKLKKKIKSITNKNIPTDLKVRLREMASINPRFIKDTDRLLEVLKDISNLLFAPSLALKQGTEFGKESQAAKDLRKAEAELKKLTDEYKEARIESLKETLEDMGVDTSLIESLYPNDPDALLQNLTETLADAKPSLVDRYKQTATALKTLVDRDLVDVSNLSQKEIDFINNEVKNIDLKGIPDSKVATLVAGLTNLLNYSSVTGLGDVVQESKVYLKSKDAVRLNKIKESISTPLLGVGAFYDFIGSGTQRKDIRIKDQLAIPQLDNVTGVSDLNIHTNSYNAFVKKTEKGLEAINKKYAKDLKDNLENTSLAIYADVAQYRESWTPEQVGAEYGLRLKAWVESLRELKLKSERNADFKKTNKYYIENLEKALDRILEYQVGADGKVSDINIKLSKEDLYNSLPRGQKEFYKYSRDNYDAIKEDFFINARINGNIDIEMDWQNYVPRTYSSLGGNTKKLENLANQAKDVNIWDTYALAGQTTKEGASQSGKSRTISGDKLPINSILSTDFVDNFLPSISKMSYDINTQSDRLYISKALDINKSPIIKEVGSENVFEVYSALATQKVTETIIMMGSGLDKGQFQGIKRAINLAGKLGVAQSLAGLFAAPKQAVEFIGIMARTDKHAVQSLLEVATGNPEAKELLKLSNVAFRDAVKSDLPTSNTRKVSSDSKTILSAMKRFGVKLEKGVDYTTDLSLKPLTSTDKLTATVGWLSFYKKYQEKTGVPVEIDAKNPNREAIDYANHMTSATLNESDITQKSKITKNTLFKSYFIFSSFAINSKLEMFSNASTLLSKGRGVDRVTAFRNVVANGLGLFAFNKLSKYLKLASIYGGAQLVKSVVSAIIDDDDKEKNIETVVGEEVDKKVAKANIDGTKNALRDYLYGGIGGETTGLVFNPAIDFFTEQFYTPEELKRAEFGKEIPTDKLTQATTMMGLAGIPIRRGADFYKSIKGATESDEEFIKKRKGVLSADKSEVVVDDYRLTEEGKAEYGVPNYSRMIDTYAAVSSGLSMFGASLQEAGNIRRISTTLKRKLVDADRGEVKNNDIDKIIRDAGIVTEIKHPKLGTVPLSAEQQIYYQNKRKEFEVKLKTKFPFERLKKRMTKEDYENTLRNKLDELAEISTLKSMGVETLKELRLDFKGDKKEDIQDKKKRIEYQRQN